jgi:hypothetical protein
VNADDTARMLDMLNAGHFDRYLTAPARDRMRLDALRALDRVAEIVAIDTTRRGDRVVTDSCPYCRKRHVHGFPEGSAEPGWRRPHCPSPTTTTFPRRATEPTLACWGDSPPAPPATQRAIAPRVLYGLEIGFEQRAGVRRRSVDAGGCR